MTRLLNLSARFPVLILLGILLVSAMAATQLPKLNIQIAAKSLSVETDPAWIAQQQNIERFGDNEITVVLIKDTKLFTPEKLERLHSLVNQLHQIEHINKVTSLYNVPNIQLIDDFVSTQPFIENQNYNTEQLDNILHQAGKNPLVIDNFINQSGTAFAINLTFKQDENIQEFDKKITAAIEQILLNYQTDFDTVSQFGSSYIRDQISEQIKKDQQTILPWSIIVLALSLAIGMRSLGGALIPLFTATISIIITLSAMAYLNIPINVMTSIVPALLIIIGSTEDIHLISEFKENLTQNKSPSQALEAMSRTMGMAVLLTFVTTYLGFLSIYANDITLLKEFGMVASSGLLINFLITSLTVPALLKLTAAKKTESPAHKPLSVFQRLALAILHRVQTYPKSLVIFLAMILVWAIIGAVNLKTNNNPLSYFRTGSAVSQAATAMQENLSGVETFSITVESGIEDTFKKVKYLEEINKIQNFINNNEQFDKSVSFADYIKLIHVTMEGSIYEKLADLSLPVEDYQVAEYLNLVDQDMFTAYVSRDYSATQIIVRHGLESSSQLRTAVAGIEEFIQQNTDPALQVMITGSSILSANGADYMASGQFKSLLLMSAIIVLLVGLLFVAWQAGLVALVPNLFPIIVLFGVMGHLGIDIDTGTAMVAVIALGICVDDTLHFMSRYHLRSRNQENPQIALQETVSEEATPIFTTSIALITGFLALSFSSFVPITNFGLLSALVILMALITTFIITPLMLSHIKLVSMWDMLSLKVQAQVIHNCELFRGMNSWSIKKTILSSQVQHFKAGQNIIEQGDQGNEMYVVLEGEVNVKVRRDNGSISTVNHISSGGAFGEIAVLSKSVRTASVYAETDCSLLTLNWKSIEQLSKYHARIAMKLFKNVAAIVGERITRMDNMLIIHDEASGCLNRTMIEESINMEIKKCKRFCEPVSFVCFSIMPILDTENLDELINQLFNSLRKDIRNVDIFGRWDEHRFVILLPRTSDQESLLISDRIHEHFQALLQRLNIHQPLPMKTWSYDQETAADIDQIRHQIDHCTL